ncbi:MAG: hypothetical protein M3137_14780 [Actinomycetota bacterium]|nr:hypothetical protein [Actinomycetota bacterium]
MDHAPEAHRSPEAHGGPEKESQGDEDGPWEVVDGGAAGLARREETKADGRRLSLYRLTAGHDPHP